MKTKQAVEHLVKSLVKDRDYWLTWEANIAMSFKDEAAMLKINIDPWKLHTLANAGASRFLNLLCSETIGDRNDE